MKRSVVIGITALVAGLLLAITAFAAPFRSYDRAADDQYTTTTPTTTTTSPTTPAGNTPPGPPSTTPSGNPVPGSTVTGQGGPAAGSDDGSGAAPEDVDGAGAPGRGREDDGAGAAPDEAAGAGAPTSPGSGTGSGAGAGRTAERGAIAILAVDSLPTRLGQSVVRVTGLPAWSGLLTDLDIDALGDTAAGTPFAGLGSGDLDFDKLRGLARRLGGDAVPGAGLATALPDLLSEFDGAVRPITGLVLYHERLDDADDLAIAESFMRSFARGAVVADIPVVGVESADTDPSSVAFFKKIKGVSSIDNADTQAGRESLVRLLAGAKPGHYGEQDSAAAAQPPRISPATASSPLSDGSGSLSGSPLLVGLLLTMALLAGRALTTVVQRSRQRA